MPIEMKTNDRPPQDCLWEWFTSRETGKRSDNPFRELQDYLVSVVYFREQVRRENKRIVSLPYDTLVWIYGGSFAKVHNVHKRMCSSVWSFENVPE